MSWVLLVLGCVAATPPPGKVCVGCHGDPSGEGEAALAPPLALGGLEEPALVGAHQAHLRGTRIGEPIPCAECHGVPERIDAPGHLDDPWPAEVTWGPVAKTGGAALPWDREVGTCTVYCHGVLLAGGEQTLPGWTDTGITCSSCHGDPPPSPHPQAPDCAACHDLTPETHIDGKLTFDAVTGATSTTDTARSTSSSLACDACHGQDGNAAPPPDLQGNTQPSSRGVGAHRAHLVGSGFARPVTCETCHVVPEAVDDPGHADGGPAEVVFSGIAGHGAATATWDPGSLTCSNTWCHGGAIAGGTLTRPTWTATDGAASACGACHGAPPPPPHPNAPNGCVGCHDNAAPGFTFYDPSRHVDGSVDLDL